MSRLLYRWGRWSATRPWIAIGAWVLLSVLVVAASAGFGKQLDDSMAIQGRVADQRPQRYSNRDMSLLLARWSGRSAR